MLNILLLFTLCFPFSFSFLFDLSSIKMITIREADSYFGYSILLQKGNPPIAIVGAPRKKTLNRTTGAVFKCDLSSLQCSDYKIFSRFDDRRPFNRNGDFLGSSLTGDDISGRKFYTCAPRFILEATKSDYFLNGRCFSIDNSAFIRTLLPLNSEKQVSLDISQHVLYYDAAFAEAGFDIAHIKDQNALLIGAPGKSLWKGAIIKTSTVSYRNSFISLPNLQFKYQDNYQGYAVTWGNFIKGLSVKWYVSGGPRGNALKGSVVFYDQDGTLSKELFSGEELGSYFGASLLVIHKVGGGDDILVGAPMFSGDSYDEGCVYYYKNKNYGSFHSPVKLTNKKSFSRFGTTMSTVGDIDLDTFADCAIAAPYEDDGVGAVYIYFGTENGFSDDKSYRISPSSFSFYPKTVIKGFGLGLSKGNDIDNNKHNDIAIGAYQSGQIFYLRTNELFDVAVNVTSNTNVVYTSSRNFTVKYCISFYYRNGNSDKSKTFIANLRLRDDRILNDAKLVSKMIVTKPKDITCFTELIFLKEDHLNIDPIVIPYEYQVNNTNLSISSNTFSIPVSYECGSDNICQTNLTIKPLTFDPLKIIFGVNNEVKVNVTVSNFGESAYQTKLTLKVPPEVSLINLRECDFQNGSYVCLVAGILSGDVEKSFLFDVTNLQLGRKTLLVDFEVKSIGNDGDTSDNKVTLSIPVGFQNNPHIDSRSVPGNVVLNKSENIKITHSFLVGNHGPSPLDLNLTIFVPKIEVDGNSLLEIKSVEGTVNDVTTNCNLVQNKFWKVKSLAKVREENDTKVIACGNYWENCSVVVCSAGYLPKSNKNGLFTLKMIVNAGTTSNLLENANKLLLISSAYYNNGTTDFFTSTSTLIVSVVDTSKLPVWIYVVSAIFGLLLLFILVFTLYKCNFFKRTYKEMMESEQSEKNRGQCEAMISDDDL